MCVCLVLDSSLATAWGDFTQRGINTNLVFPGGWGERVSTFTRQVRIIIICPRRGVGVGECPLVLDLRWGRNSAASEFHLLPPPRPARPPLPRPCHRGAAAPYQALSELVVSSDPNSSERQALCSPPCPAPSLQMGKVRPRGARQQSQTQMEPGF